MKLLLLICLFIYIRRITTYKIPDFIPDIIIKPGGRYGFYMSGICHYIKNHFDIKNKKILGVSAGAWSGLLMNIKKEHTNMLIRDILKKQSNKIHIIMNNIKNAFNQYPLTMFEIDNLYIATTNVSKREFSIHHDFLFMNEVTLCCESSSFIPGLTCKNLFNFYKHNLSLDGGFCFKKYLKKLDFLEKKPLIISHKMFGRHEKTKLYDNVIKKYPKNHSYYLYIKGYHDAKVNHAYFLDYLKELK